MKRIITSCFILTLIAPVISLNADKEAYLKKWKEFEEKGRFEEAIAVYKKAAAQYPDEAWFEIFIAHSFNRLGKPERALPHYERAYKLMPEEDGIKANVYYGYLSFAAHLGFEKQDWKGAVLWYKKATLVRPDDCTAYNLLGNALRNARRHEDSYSAFLRAYELDANHVNGDLAANFRAGMLEGMNYCINHCKNRAVQFADLSLRAYPNDREMLTSAITVYLETDNVERAVSLVDAMPAGKERELARGAILLKTGTAEEAARIFESLSEDHPDDYLLDDRIASIFRSEIDSLKYSEQMASPYQKSVVAFNTRAVEKYFKAKPYNQRITIHPPLRGIFTIAQGAGGISFHNGLRGHYSYDLVQKMGDSIYTVAEGTVEFVEDTHPDNPVGAPVDLNAQGNGIIIRHGSIRSIYWHIQKGSAMVRRGDRVTAGQKIARIGNSGISGGPHLHFELKNDEDYTVPPVFTDLQRRPASSVTEWEPVTTLEPGFFFRYELR